MVAQGVQIVKRRTRIIVVVVAAAALLVLIASVGIGSRPSNPLEGRPERGQETGAVQRGASTTQIISGIVVGVVVAIATTLVGHLLTRSREREHWDREDRRHRETREHEWQLQHRTDRLQLYRRFLVDLEEIKPQAAGPDQEPQEKAELTMNEIQLLGSEAMRETAYSLLFTHVTLADYRGRVLSGELSENDPEVRREMEARVTNLTGARVMFMDSARRDLRVDSGMRFDSFQPAEGRDPEG